MKNFIDDNNFVYGEMKVDENFPFVFLKFPSFHPKFLRQERLSVSTSPLIFNAAFECHRSVSLRKSRIFSIQSTALSLFPSLFTFPV
jgi:hypothetical protein